MFDVELICVIVNCGYGTKIIKSAKQNGVNGATIALGHGTVCSRLLDFIGICEVRKEIVFMVAEKEVANNAMEQLNKEFKFYKPNHGIAFSMTISGVWGAYLKQAENEINKEGEEIIMYNIITTIVDKGKAEEVISAATLAGSKGGTIINARGAGVFETTKLFAMDIEPEKEIVIIVSEEEKTDAIVSSIRENLKIEEPRNGIIYVQQASKTYGLNKN